MGNSLKIAGFFGEYRFLSNFWPASITILGIPYLNVEAAYQASKSYDMTVRKSFSHLSPKEAKAKGRIIKFGGDWSDVSKVTSMELCLRAKFNIPELKARLISTNGFELEETNTWNDQFWGVCRGKGRNLMGKLLMGLRDELVMYDYPNIDDVREIPF